MKNIKYFPFERNRYFYGKLLSVDDFETEQRYMNDKRRLINRFLHGTGVVCGLQVVEVDDVTISVEMGVALDFSGREIVVAQPVTRKLSSIDGFHECEEDEEERRDLYLGIVYDEREREPVHNIARVDNRQEEEYNKYEESYRLFVTAEEPEREGNRRTELYEQTKTVYRGNGIRIRQTVPRYVQSGREVELEVAVEKTEQTKPVAFSYQLRLNGFERDGCDTVGISFEEESFSPSDRYVFRERIRAREVANAEGCVEAVPESLTLTVGQETKRDRVFGAFQVRISDDDIRQTMIQEYYRTAMEDIMRDTYQQPIYLARLEVIRAGDTYVIEKVENLPCQQYVWNSVLTAALESMRLRNPMDGRFAEYIGVRSAAGAVRAGVNGGQEAMGSGGMSELRNTIEPGVQIRTGGVWIRLGLGGVEGQCYYSGEIVHGLGPGEVFLTLGISQGEQGRGLGIFGNPDLFEDVKCPRVELAAKADMGRGCFVIALKCLEQTPAGRLRINWMAVRGSGKPSGEERGAELTIRPDIAGLRVGESQYFEAFLGNEAKRQVEWSVKSAGGGSINADGCYMAPVQPGVYEIEARSMDDRGVAAVAFAIVRSTE